MRTDACFDPVGVQAPRRPPSLDPIVAELIEALARSIIRDEDRASRPATEHHG